LDPPQDVLLIHDTKDDSDEMNKKSAAESGDYPATYSIGLVKRAMKMK
jgi:hypothetical protein